MPTEKLKFIFICPTQNRMFESADFSVLENRGVIVDAAGNKTLDAKVALNKPCPFCGAKHVYHAGELSCPFGTSENE
jgi:Zn finger protein HypA/HybF involved in hydrogenase expression